MKEQMRQRLERYKSGKMPAEEKKKMEQELRDLTALLEYLDDAEPLPPLEMEVPQEKLPRRRLRLRTLWEWIKNAIAAALLLLLLLPFAAGLFMAYREAVPAASDLDWVALSSMRAVSMPFVEEAWLRKEGGSWKAYFEDEVGHSGAIQRQSPYRYELTYFLRWGTMHQKTVPKGEWFRSEFVQASRVLPDQPLEEPAGAALDRVKDAEGTYLDVEKLPQDHVLEGFVGFSDVRSLEQIKELAARYPQVQIQWLGVDIGYGPLLQEQEMWAYLMGIDAEVWREGQVMLRGGQITGTDQEVEEQLRTEFLTCAEKYREREEGWFGMNPWGRNLPGTEYLQNYLSSHPLGFVGVTITGRVEDVAALLQEEQNLYAMLINDVVDW
ncbi:MAG: hypothetical protein ACOX7F_02580 [Eubacteriales bacterium]